MDIAPIYELRTRLRAAAIAGTNLLSEDFRLKRAVEAIQPLEAASPVFAKIGALARSLLAPEQGDKEGVLLDTITLVDALLCTQGEVAVAGEVQPLTLQSGGSAISNAPYSDVKMILDALTNSGGGRYSYLTEMHEKRPELFEDYRVKPALVQALGASYAELAEDVKKWLKGMGESLLPLLEKDFDPKGKKEMLRRVEVIDAIAGSKANDFYLKQLPDSEKEIRQMLIYALRHSPENEECLLSLIKTEKGKAKKMAYCALACQEGGEAKTYVAKLMEKKPEEALAALSMSEADWASDMVQEGLLAWLEQFEARLKSDSRFLEDEKDAQKEFAVLDRYLEALCGKSSQVIAVCCRRIAALAVSPKTLHLKLMSHFTHEQRLDKCSALRDALGRRLSDYLMIRPDKELTVFILELFDTYRETPLGEALFPAAAQARLLGEEDCTPWLRREAVSRGWLKERHVKDKDYMPYKLIEAFKGLHWDEKKKKWVIEKTVYSFDMEIRHEYVHEVRQQIKGEFTRFLMEIPGGRLDFVLSACIPRVEPDDALEGGVFGEAKEYERTVMDYFYRQALKGLKSISYCTDLRLHNYPKCEGLAVQMLSEKKTCHMWEITSVFNNLPGSTEAKRAEGQEVLKRIRSGRIQVSCYGGKSEMEQIEFFLETLT